MNTTADTQPTVPDLSEVTASSAWTPAEEIIVRYYRAVVRVYLPAPEGGAYCHNVTCTHNHRYNPVADQQDVDLCREKMARIINRDKRIPAWATFA